MKNSVRMYTTERLLFGPRAGPRGGIEKQRTNQIKTPSLPRHE